MHDKLNSVFTDNRILQGTWAVKLSHIIIQIARGAVLALLPVSPISSRQRESLGMKARAVWVPSTLCGIFFGMVFHLLQKFLFFCIPYWFVHPPFQERCRFWKRAFTWRALTCNSVHLSRALCQVSETTPQDATATGCGRRITRSSVRKQRIHFFTQL